MIQAVLGGCVVLLAGFSWYLHTQSKEGMGGLFAVLAAGCLTGFIQSTVNSPALTQWAVMLPWVVFAAGLVSLTVACWVLLSKRRLRVGLRKLGIKQVWTNRGKGFYYDHQDYLGYCRTLIRRADAGTTIRLMSTAGDGIAIMGAELDTAFREPLLKGCHFQIILGNPLSERIEKKQQAEDLSGRYGTPRSKGSVRQKIRDKIRFLDQWREAATTDPSIKALTGAIQVRCIEDFPVANLIDNGKESLIALQVVDRKGGDSPVFLVSQDGALYKFLHEHFVFLFEKMSVPADQIASKFDIEIAPTLGVIPDIDRKA